MGITLKNAMKIGKFAECEVVAGHKGLHKEVEQVTVMEVPNIVNWLKGKELLLTSLFSIKDDEEALSTLIPSLKRAGVTALAIKPTKFLNSIPDNLLLQANQLDFPVIKIPEQVSYLDILTPVMHAIFNDKVVIQEDLEQASKILNEISINPQDIDVFINTLKYLTKNVITIESHFPFMKISKGDVDISPLTEIDKNELSLIKHPIKLKRKYGAQWVSCIVAPIIVDKRLYGNITCWELNSESLGLDIAILEKASSLLAIEFFRLKIKHEIDQQYKHEFIRDLLFNESMDEKDLRDRGENYQLFLNRRYVCALVQRDKNNSEFEEAMIMNKVESHVQDHFVGAIIGRIRSYLCMIIPIEESKESSFHQYCEQLFYDLSYLLGTPSMTCMGVGRSGQDVKGIRRSYFQAEQAVKFGYSRKQQREVIFYDDLGVYRLLHQLSEEKELEEFYKETVGRLVENDQNHDLNLVQTLKYYFQFNENLKLTSQEMFIHVNTLKYRIHKIELLTGYSLQKSDEKMMLYLGLKIYEMLTAPF
ncbi:PucR family transcriptional regulator ligand-binding domain-containing protein [Neobacillus niacini]|uniref:PucR family transcriptional regulator n=1 Tax=Neobacillus niacini TaxID=86668 RepID=UPI003002AA51